jgi:O-acetylserine/cysteine efflux transporter
MTRKDGLLALLVVIVWGLNFVVIKVGLHNMPPLMLAGLRFLLVAFPALFFVARPTIPFKLLLGVSAPSATSVDEPLIRR